MDNQAPAIQIDKNADGRADTLVTASATSQIGTEPPTGIEENKTYSTPTSFVLSPNYPNPFNSKTTIEYALPQANHVHLAVYNVLGQVVRVLVNDFKPPGYHRVYWDGRNTEGYEVASGMYTYRIKAGTFVQVHKMLLLR